VRAFATASLGFAIVGFGVGLNFTAAPTSTTTSLSSEARLSRGDRTGNRRPGGFQLLHTLIEHDPVDELRVKIYPVMLGAGECLFGETSDKKPRRLTVVQTLETA
jgi:dihydrofolate reductase